MLGLINGSTALYATAAQSASDTFHSRDCLSPNLVTRLLGFSAGLRQWREVRLGLEERIERYHLLPFLILAHSNQEVQAFKTRADIGRAWPSAPARRPYNSGGPAMSQPPSRMNAIGFSTYTGGLYDVDRTPAGKTR